MHIILMVLIFSLQPADAASQQPLLKKFREEFVEIIPGKGRYPKHESLSRYSIAKYEVPQNLWQSVMGSNPSRWKGTRNSVEQISFADANAFCARTTKLMREAKLIAANEEIRLPFEDEWEYAARAGTKSAYSFGDDVEKLDKYAWSTRNAAGNDPAVGALKPNPWGLYDVHGYLWEWCLTRPASIKAEKKDERTGTKAVDEKPESAVLRGGSWKDPAEKLETSFRMLVKQSDKDDAVGFRCVLAEQSPAPAEEPKRKKK